MFLLKPHKTPPPQIKAPTHFPASRNCNYCCFLHTRKHHIGLSNVLVKKTYTRERERQKRRKPTKLVYKGRNSPWHSTCTTPFTAQSTKQELAKRKRLQNLLHKLSVCWYVDDMGQERDRTHTARLFPICVFKAHPHHRHAQPTSTFKCVKCVKQEERTILRRDKRIVQGRSMWFSNFLMQSFHKFLLILGPLLQWNLGRGFLKILQMQRKCELP